MKTSPLKNKSPLKARTPLKSKTTLKAGTKKLSKSSKTPVNKLKKKADAAYSKALRLRFADKKEGEWFVKCITCPNYKPIAQMQCGHFMSRKHNSTRYEPENTAPQCYGCNVMQQGKQYEFSIELDLMYGDGTAKKMMELSKIPHQFTQEELEQIIEDANQEIMFYERQP